MLNRHKAVLQPKNAELEKLMQAAAAVLETEPGKLLFAHLFYRAGYNSPEIPAHAIGRVDGDGLEQAGTYNSARRALYIELRALVPKTHRKTLLEVELLAEDGWGSGVSQSKPAEVAETKKP